MNLDVVIPTRKRLDKLAVCLNSIQYALQLDNVKCYVYFSSDTEVMQFSWKYPLLHKLVKATAFPDYTAPKLWNYHLNNMEADGMMYLNDDVEMLDEGLIVGKNQFVLTFPDYDGVLGFTQANLKGRFDTAPAAFGIVGSKFADRFPNRQAFCPDYRHLWIDRELEYAAKHHGKFHFSNQVKLNHFHPCLDKKYEDDTHYHIRQHKTRDKKTWEERKARGWTWGIDFNLLGENWECLR